MYYLAVCAATLFFIFLRMSRSSGLRWSRLARFLAGWSDSSSSSSSLTSSESRESTLPRLLVGEGAGRGLLLPAKGRHYKKYKNYNSQNIMQFYTLEDKEHIVKGKTIP